jgi:hypothetical protein
MISKLYLGMALRTVALLALEEVVCLLPPRLAHATGAFSLHFSGLPFPFPYEAVEIPECREKAL